MATDGDELRFDWAGLVSQVVHPIKVEIVEAMTWIGEPLSAFGLEQLLDRRHSLSLVSYHLTALAKPGVMEEVSNRQACGATEHFYFFRARWS